MIERHPFGSFVPNDAKYLILGSFPSNYKGGKSWFYGSERNQFWPILEKVYGVRLKTIEEKKRLFRKQKIALTDVVLECERRKSNNSDNNLKILKFNKKEIARIIKVNRIEKIYFTSRFVENIFKRRFKNLISQYPNIKYITLPSPSPRYAAMSFSEKCDIYKKVLPNIS